MVSSPFSMRPRVGERLACGRSRVRGEIINVRPFLSPRHVSLVPSLPVLRFTACSTPPPLDRPAYSTGLVPLRLAAIVSGRHFRGNKFNSSIAESIDVIRRKSSARPRVIRTGGVKSVDVAVVVDDVLVVDRACSTFSGNRLDTLRRLSLIS